MNHTFRYGKKTFEFHLPDKAQDLRVRDPLYSVDREKFTSDLMNALPDDRSSYSNVGIVVADKTRLCGYPDYLPWVTEILERKGADKEKMHFYIAYGTHPKQTRKESMDSYGTAFNDYHFIHHNCWEEEAVTEIGVTSRGTPVKIRKDVLQCSLLITFGAITHHYFAGYGGGRKLLFPGLADRKSIYRNHSLFLDREKKRLSPGCQPGNLDGNPIAEDLKEIDDLMPSKISIHGILDSQGKVADLLVGKSYEDFISACSIHDSFYRSGLNETFDLVIASSGGYPKDINFIQAHKSIHNAAAFVKDNGRLIILSECRDGIASDYFLKYIEGGNFEKSFDILSRDYEGNGGTALSMMTKTRRIHISMLTSLDQHLCKILNVTKLTPEIIQDILKEEKGSVAVIGNASLLLK